MKCLSINKRMAAAALVVLFICSYITGCSGKSAGTPRVQTYVSDDEMFFDVAAFDISEHYTSQHLYGNVVPGVLLYGDNEMITSIKTSSMNRDGTISDSWYYEKFDYEGNRSGLVRQGYTSQVPMTSMFVNDGEYYGIFARYYMSSDYIIYKLDFEAEVLVECSRFSLTEDDGLLTSIRPVCIDDNILISADCGSGLAVESSIISIDVSGDMKWKRKFDFYIYDFLKWDDTCILLHSADNRFYIYDINSDELTELVIDRELYGKYLTNGTLLDDGNICLERPDRIDVLNLRDMSENILVDFNYCDFNMSDFSSCQVESIFSDKIILHDTDRHKPGESIYRWKTIVLSYNDQNPYAGRPILEIAQMHGVNDLLGAGVYEYNHSQTEYFAYISGRYNVDGDFVIPEIYGEDLTPTQINQLITDQLKLDILNGDGPDIVVGLGDTTSLNYSDCLYDFNRLIENDQNIDTGEYFTNGFYAFENDRGMFQIPLEIGGYGILADVNNGCSDDIGFTYDGYISLVDANYGFDMIGYRSRIEYMECLYRNNERFFFNHGRPNFDCEEFRTMAEYLYDYVTEDGLDSDSEDVFVVTHSHPNYYYVAFNGFYEDIQYDVFQREDWNVYGIPSLETQGPVLSVSNSIAVATCTADIDVSWNFVKLMLSENVQVHALNNPVNISAFYTYAQNSLNLIEYMYEDIGIRVPHQLSDADIERYRLMLDRIGHTDAIDTEIYAIVCEEIPSYFSGDKSLDQVIEIINRRSQIVINERGL